MPADLDPADGASPGSLTSTARTLTGSGASTDAGPSTGSGLRWSRLAGFVSGLYRQALVDPIEQGRLRDLEWPYGLRSIVLTGYIVFVIAGLLVIFSGLIREH
ncbi:MAG TPA: hypothetical protein VHR39_12885, partial [Propionibacteriaceae bacterium]|nr:hypothetical protein [Propionibacteriaceae bacterium]